MVSGLSLRRNQITVESPLVLFFVIDTLERRGLMKKWMVLLTMLVVGCTAPMVEDEAERIRLSLQKAIPAKQPDRIVQTPIAGVYEVIYGTEIYYASANGQFLIKGEVLDLAQKKNLTEESRSAARQVLIESLDRNSMIIFAPKEVKHHMTVFSDVDCTYCRKLHEDIEAINGYGIEVRYLLFPRAGLYSESAIKAESVWCASDRNKALTEAKLGKDVPKKRCDNPLAKNIELADQIGLLGTPTIILDNGKLLSGYVPAAELNAMLEAGNKK